MTELLKREVSLTVLKVRMLDANANSAPASVDATANQTLTPNQRIFCELQVTGNPEERGLVAPAAPSTTNRPASRRSNTANRASYEALNLETPASLTRTLAQWSFATEEIQLPVHYSAAMRFQDKPSVMGGWLADLARTAATKLFSEIRADTLERFAAGLNWLPSGKPTLPSTMARQLQSLLPSVMREADSLWLELAEPTGYLPLLPWEEMLRPVTTAPILRLSPHSIMAHRPERALSVVLCLTVPSEKWTSTEEELTRMARAIRDSLPAGSTLHVFPDDLCHGPFLAAKARVEKDGAGESRIKVYDLPRESPVAASADEPWRVWIGHSLAQSAADIVHCVAPGMLFADQARLVIRREPFSPGLDKRALRYVTPLELSKSLTLLGAWAVVFSSPPRGTWAVQSRMGLRLFNDQIARLRPGVSALYDLEADPEGKALTETYEFIIGDPSIKASTSPAVSVYCHPARAARIAAQPKAIAPELMSQYLGIQETIQTAFGGRPLPVWLGATLRIAEQAVSRVATGEMKGVDEATMRGIAAALKYVQQMVADQAEARASAAGPSSSPQQGGGVNA